MNQTISNNDKDQNFFKVPHEILEGLHKLLTPQQLLFFIVLCKLRNRYGRADGTFWHTDKKFETANGKIEGFESYGISSSTCKRARGKLGKHKIVFMRKGSNYGHKGTFYKINDELFFKKQRSKQENSQGSI